MADIIEQHKTEITELCEEVSKGLDDLKRAKGLTGVKRNDRIGQLKGRIGRAKTALRSIKVELREMPKLEAKPFQEKANQLEEKIKQLEVDIDWAEKADPNDATQTQAETTDYKAVLDKGAAIQQEDLTSLGRIKQKVVETTQLGADTLVTMQAQREQIIRVDQGVDQVSSNIKLANKHLRMSWLRISTLLENTSVFCKDVGSTQTIANPKTVTPCFVAKVFVRRLATDKIIMGFMFLIFVGIIVIIVYSVIHKNAKTNVPKNWRTG